MKQNILWQLDVIHSKFEGASAEQGWYHEMEVCRYDIPDLQNSGTSLNNLHHCNQFHGGCGKINTELSPS